MTMSCMWMVHHHMIYFLMMYHDHDVSCIFCRFSVVFNIFLSLYLGIWTSKCRFETKTELLFEISENKVQLISTVVLILQNTWKKTVSI